METDKLDELIKEIASRNGIVISKDDPICVIQTMYQKLLEESITSQNELFQSFDKSLIEHGETWKTSMDTLHDHVSKTARLAISESLPNILKEVMDSNFQLMDDQFNRVKDNITLQINRSQKLMNATLIASFLTLSASCYVLWAVVKN